MFSLQHQLAYTASYIPDDTIVRNHWCQNLTLFSSPASEFTKTHSVAFDFFNVAIQTGRDMTKLRRISFWISSPSAPKNESQYLKTDHETDTSFSNRTAEHLCKVLDLEDYWSVRYSRGCVHMITFVPHFQVHCLLSESPGQRKHAHLKCSHSWLLTWMAPVVSRNLKLCTAKTKAIRAADREGPCGWAVEAPQILFWTALTYGSGFPVLNNLEVAMGPSGLPFVWNVLHDKFIVSRWPFTACYG
jgi:hypothetical protein